MKQPYAYLRKSRVTTDRHVSWEVQEAAVREMAGPNVVILSDWNKSGRKGAAGRPGYKQLLEDIERGQVAALYSYSLSRLSRSLADFSKLVELCQAHGVPIHLYSERHLDFNSASGRLMVNILSAFAQMEAELAQERARDTVAVRRARGDHIGPMPFRDADVVIEAYQEAGSIAGAAKLLTKRGIPTRNGKRIWQATSVRTILLRAAPEMLPVVHGRGIKKQAPFTFYRLLLCSCGKYLTGVRTKNGSNPNYVLYRCLMGRFDPDHGPQSIPERTVLLWAMEEAAHLQPPTDLVQIARANEEKEKTLRQRKDRLRRVFVDGLIEEAEYGAELAQLDQELLELESAGRAMVIRPIDWGKTAEAVNAALREIWRVVRMTPEMHLPEKADWWLEDWRRA